MKPFAYLEPGNLAEAVKLLAHHGQRAAVIAGGQSLLLSLKNRSIRPEYLISIAAVPELQGWCYNSRGELEVGAAVSYAALAAAQLRGWHGEVASVAANLADDAVRNMGTMGGAACQAEPRFDVPPLLVGLAAQMTIQSTEGSRVVAAEQFFSPNGGTRLTATQILTRITFPPPTAYTTVAFEKFRLRAFDAALVSVVCALHADGADNITRARITVGAVERTPVTASRTAAELLGQSIQNMANQALGDRVSAEVIPAETRASALRAYQAELLKVLVRAAMRRASLRPLTENSRE